jgi:hypothetical protein
MFRYRLPRNSLSYLTWWNMPNKWDSVGGGKREATEYQGPEVVHNGDLL